MSGQVDTHRGRGRKGRDRGFVERKHICHRISAFNKNTIIEHIARKANNASGKEVVVLFFVVEEVG